MSEPVTRTAGGGRLWDLARAVGIEPGYQDVWGQWHGIGERTVRQLLESMGIAADTDDGIAASLSDLESRAWRTLLPRFVSTEADGAPGIEMTLPEGIGGALAWTVTPAEGGEPRGGQHDLSTLPPVEQRHVDGVRRVRRWLRLPPLEPGWYRLTIRAGEAQGETDLLVAPDRAWTPADALGEVGRGWGLSVQLYGIRSAENWGLGDFADLRRLMRIAAELGADFVGVNPIHAGFPADPENFGPYGPSHRAFLNVLHIAVPEVPDFAESGEAQSLVAGAGFKARLEAARTAELVDYPAVHGLKMPVLELCWRHFRAHHIDRQTARAKAFFAFCEARGEDLRRLALFDALQTRFLAEDRAGWFWGGWPDAFRHPEAPGSASFADEEAERVGFFAWLQWEADRQLQAVTEEGRRAGLRLGLYRDLAIASNPGGAAAWSWPDVVLLGPSVGAPPDIFSPLGQNWGLAPLSPVGLRETGFQVFTEAVRANMAGSGCIRMDHVMGLKHLFWVPPHGAAAEGAYVAYPFDDLMRILRLESQRHRCVVIGEDLGTVPEGFRPALRKAGILSSRVLWFERGPDQGFIAPEHYEREALIGATTHDLPTIRGWWLGRDIDWRDRAGLFPEPGEGGPDRATEEREERRLDRDRLTASLDWHGVVPEGGIGAEGEGLAEAALRYLARTPGRLLVVQLEDLMGEVEQPNLPGTIDQHPNWRRKLPLTLDGLAADATVRRLADAIREERAR